MKRTKTISPDVSKFCSCIAGGLMLLGLSHSASGKAFVIPHILEKSGLIADTTNTFDTTLELTYNATLNGSDKGAALVDLYLYDDAGQLMRGTSQNVCGPCTYNLSAQQRKLSIRIDDLLTANGGGFDTTNKTGFAVVLVSGPGADAVNLQGFVVNSHTSAFDSSVFGYTPQPIGTHRSPPGTPATKKTFCFPHVLETSGRAMISDPNAVDSVLYATYTGGLSGVPTNDAGATLEFYLYDQQTGQPMIGGGGSPVCNPCMFNLGTSARKQTIYVDDLITAAGGYGGAISKVGFGIIVVGGADPDGVNLQGFVVNSHTGPFDVSVMSFQPPQIKTNSTPTTRTSFVIPHILEKSGLTSSQTFTFDTSLLALYTGGIGGIPQGAGASLDVYLYDDSGAPMTGLAGTAVCNPCTFDLGTGDLGSNSPRKRVIRIDDLITARGGGFDSAEKTGFAVLVVGGADPEGVCLQGFVVNSHTGPFDRSVFGFDPQPVTAAGLALFDDGTSGLDSRAFVIPHILETSGTINATQFTFDTTLYMTYAGGLTGTLSSNGAMASLYLYDSAGGKVLKSGTGLDVCNPCMFDLNASSRKASITIDDLITAKGGFGTQTNRDAFGVIVLDGDTTNVKLQSFVVNAHTSPFDLSVFGFEPQPIAAARMIPMPITINNNGASIEITLSTVIGGHYAIQDVADFGASWGTVLTFDGDGTVQTKTVPVTGSTKHFFRVSGY